ncbi:MAG: HEAT repeat domain-containing protein [Elusimicrobia bacterium]|nr:HEAT repeat domain-containing protein [Elusimicrobiota bacterium]
MRRLFLIFMLGLFTITTGWTETDGISRDEMDKLIKNIDSELLARVRYSQLIIAGNTIEIDRVEGDCGPELDRKAVLLNKGIIKIDEILKGKYDKDTITVFSVPKVVKFNKDEKCIFFIDKLNSDSISIDISVEINPVKIKTKKCNFISNCIHGGGLQTGAKIELRDENYAATILNEIKNYIKLSSLIDTDKKLRERIIVRFKNDLNNDFFAVAGLCSVISSQDKENMSMLTDLMSDGNNNSHVRMYIAGDIGNRRYKEAVEPLFQIVKNGLLGELPFSAASALGKIGTGESIESLVKAMDLSKSPIPGALRIVDPQTIDPLIEALDNENYTISYFAVEQLGMIGDRKAVEPLIKLFPEQNMLMKIKIAVALYQCGSEKGEQLLYEMLADKNKRYVVADSLSCVERRDITPFIGDLPDSGNEKEKKLGERLMRQVNRKKVLANFAGKAD